ncbi:RNA polymerase sigma factor [Paenibacillus tarimensis]|uniref:RNA polymerase sigma factor n=1 Tax=Paenibacillus tarimensis TaxID=416012 RepID=UPI001F1D5ED2|nr:sigma-70 family RNA polymerase sigma factor [Paenibacillus tarimensis]MCF2942462.1 sigma-70 family RNA polymerase sigma factor [Paenibacillus tarimensis]
MSAQQEPNPSELLHAMCRGSVEAFELFYRRYAPLVLQIAGRMLDDRMEAEDLCHDIFMEVLRKGDRYSCDKGSIEAWLAVMTRSRALDRIRRGRKVVLEKEDGSKLTLTSEASSGVMDALEEQVVIKLEQEAVREAMRELPVTQQKALTAIYYGNKTHRETSEEWNVPLGTVKSWVRYGLNNLRKRLSMHSHEEKVTLDVPEGRGLT